MGGEGLRESSTKRIWELESVADLDRLLEMGTVVLYKHSADCWISAMTWKHVRRFAKKSPKVNIGVITVTEDDSLSEVITERFGIRHESPQAIVIRDGEPLWHASHLKVTARALLEAVAGG